MPVLDKFRQYHYDATVKVSDNTRTLALSAVGIVWLFKNQNGGVYEIPNDLLVPLILVVIALALDFGQHVYRSIAWHIKFRIEEKRLGKKEITEETELYASKWINTFAYFVFYGKVLCLVAAYCGLLSYFSSMVNWV
ncbi:hypothetical protein [Pseudoalteromonas rubra]|uniref:Uncharacterized protein n=1 Tax=Pseudoalteromonas rubra TaxID=43658 RepID=A0A5S3WZ97_9GAMM|nr:hypothetical protein [Pseudoalteromonas rubra]TMP37096.1 hypothetical protein CWB98_12410 [Pseudoalteromonas rubra]